MTTVAHALGTPRVAAQRGGDCRARDLDQTRNIHGPHRFAATTHCRISNGLLRLTVGPSGAAPSLTVEGWRGRVTIEDYLVDTLVDTLDGAIATPAWQAMGTLTIDSPSVGALLTAARVVRLSSEAVTIRLVAPLMADAFLTLRRGERMVRVQHGSTRVPLVTTSRRVRWTAAPSPAGYAYSSRVEEQLPKVEGFPRFLAGVDSVTTDAAAFSLTSAVVQTTTRFGAGIGIDATYDRTHDHHRQLGDASRPRLVVA